MYVGHIVAPNNLIKHIYNLLLLSILLSKNNRVFFFGQTIDRSNPSEISDRFAKFFESVYVSLW